MNRIEIDAKDAVERTALHWACAEGYSEIVRLLLKNHALDSCIDVSGQTALHYTVQKNSTASIEAFLSMKELTHLPNNEGRTPLMAAAANASSKAVRLLLRNKMIALSIDHTDPSGQTSE